MWTFGARGDWNLLPLSILFLYIMTTRLIRVWQSGQKINTWPVKPPVLDGCLETLCNWGEYWVWTHSVVLGVWSEVNGLHHLVTETLQSNKQQKHNYFIEYEIYICTCSYIYKVLYSKIIFLIFTCVFQKSIFKLVEIY